MLAFAFVFLVPVQAVVLFAKAAALEVVAVLVVRIPVLLARGTVVVPVAVEPLYSGKSPFVGKGARRLVPIWEKKACDVKSPFANIAARPLYLGSCQFRANR